jgi:DNA-binding response OmpR family regulator
MKILIVEDDERIASFVVKGLRAEGYATVVAADGDTALRFLHDGDPFDIVLLDLGLPGTPGEEVLVRARRSGLTTPFIILTARTGIGDKVRGLDLGANDYVTKPFAFEELLARIRAIKRSAAQSSASELVVDDLRLDLLSKIAQRGGRNIELSQREWALLELFMRHPTHVLSSTTSTPVVTLLTSTWATCDARSTFPVSSRC